MATESTLSAEEQYALVHEAIQAVASHCDGAQTKDGVGFNGQDTKYGKRMAAVPFEKLTADDHEEEARIILTYRQQVLTYTGVDVSDLPVVKAAQDFATNHNSRQNARDHERRTRNASKADERKIDTDPNGGVYVSWVKGDPDFGALLNGVKAIPGRQFRGDGWAVPVNPRTAPMLQALAAEFDFPVTEKAAKLLSDTAVEEWAGPVRNAKVVGQFVTFAWDRDDPDFWVMKEALKDAGCSWNRPNASVWNIGLDRCAEAVAVAVRYNFTGLDEIKAHLGDVLEAHKVEQSLADMLRTISFAADPTDLPESFVALVNSSIK